MTDHLKIAIAGARGRMGQQLVSAALDAGHAVTGGTEQAGSAHIGTAMGDGTISDNAAQAAQGATVWIDFTRPDATLAALNALSTIPVKTVIIGTTGFSAAEDEMIAVHAGQLAIVKAGNFSLGVNLLEALVQQAASRLGADWDIEITETHHRRKVDAPSGTALMLGQAAASGRGDTLQNLQTAPYNGPDAKRGSGKIGFASRRMGDVIGDHEVSFGSDLEIVSLRHIALDRSVFAYGAIKAAEWAVNQPPGLYSMADVLGV